MSVAVRREADGNPVAVGVEREPADLAVGVAREDCVDHVLERAVGVAVRHHVDHPDAVRLVRPFERVGTEARGQATSLILGTRLETDRPWQRTAPSPPGRAARRDTAAYGGYCEVFEIFKWVFGGSFSEGFPSRSSGSSILNVAPVPGSDAA